MKLLPIHYSATRGELCRRTERGQHPISGGLLWDGQPMPVPVGSGGAVDGSKGCGMGRHSQSCFQGLPGRRWVSKWWLEFCKAVRRGRMLTPCWGWEEVTREDLSCRQEEWDKEKGRGEESSLQWCVLGCPVWTAQIPPMLCCCPSFGPCTKLVLSAVARGLFFLPMCKGTCPLLRDRRGQWRRCSKSSVMLLCFDSG